MSGASARLQHAKGMGASKKLHFLSSEVSLGPLRSANGFTAIERARDISNGFRCRSLTLDPELLLAAVWYRRERLQRANEAATNPLRLTFFFLFDTADPEEPRGCCAIIVWAIVRV